MFKFINLTPHALTVEGIGTLEPSGVVARVGTERHEIPALVGVRVISQDLGDVENLPTPAPGVAYIVSALVLSALKDERAQGLSNRAGVDVFAPDTGPDAIRENGQIKAVRGLVC